MSELKKKFMTMNFLGSKMILPQLVEYSTDTKKLSLAEFKEELEGQKVFSSIKNGALNNMLREMGISWEPIEEIRAYYGDIIYEIQVVGLKEVYKYSDLPTLPGYCSLVPQRILIYEKN